MTVIKKTYAQYADVIAILPQQISNKVESGSPLAIQKPTSDVEINQYLLLATSEIDSAISTNYQVPLKRIKQQMSDGTFTPVYPSPVVNCCAYIAASMLYAKLFGESQNPDSAPKYSEMYRDRANKYLDDIRNGNTILDGQRMLGRRYVRGETRDAPKVSWEPKDIKG